MIIDNYELVEIVTRAINEYNDQFWDEKDKDKRISYDSIKFTKDDECMEIPDEILRKIPTLTVAIRPDRYSKEEMQGMFDILKDIVDVMQPTNIRFNMIQKHPRIYDGFDFSILDHLGDNIEYLGLNGVDLSKKGPELFSRFQSLKTLNLEKCNIQDPSIIDGLNPATFVSLQRNTLDPSTYPKALELLERTKGRISFSDKELSRLSDILKLGKMSIEEYLKFKDIIDLTKIKNISIAMLDPSKLTKEQAESFIESFNLSSNVSLEISPENLNLIDPERKIQKPVKLAIRDLRDLTREDLATMPTAQSIRIRDDGCTNYKEDFNTYSVDEYNLVRQKVEEIVSKVKVPPEDDPHRQMKIFTQVYKLLGTSIKYNYDAISEEAKDDESLRVSCRNLVDGLTKGRCVCAGYANILKNVLAMFGIESEYIAAMPDFENGVPINFNDPEGHAWNLVTLDGQKYWTDLTWDAPYLEVGRMPLPYFLKSTKDFGHKDYQKRLQDLIQDPAPRSVSDEEQIRLFTGRELDPPKDPETKRTEKAVGYLGIYALAAARKGCNVQAVKKAEELCTRANTAKRKAREGG